MITLLLTLPHFNRYFQDRAEAPTKGRGSYLAKVESLQLCPFIGFILNALRVSLAPRSHSFRAQVPTFRSLLDPRQMPQGLR